MQDLPEEEYFNCIFKRSFFGVTLKQEIKPSLYKTFNKFIENLFLARKTNFLRTREAFFNCVSKLQQADIMIKYYFLSRSGVEPLT